MNKVIRVIGSVILSILFVGIPVIFGASIVANWSDYIILSLGISTISEICVVGVWVYFAAEEEV